MSKCAYAYRCAHVHMWVTVSYTDTWACDVNRKNGTHTTTERGRGKKIATTEKYPWAAAIKTAQRPQRYSKIAVCICKSKTTNNSEQTNKTTDRASIRKLKRWIKHLYLEINTVQNI